MVRSFYCCAGTFALCPRYLVSVRVLFSGLFATIGHFFLFVSVFYFWGARFKINYPQNPRNKKGTTPPTKQMPIASQPIAIPVGSSSRSPSERARSGASDSTEVRTHLPAPDPWSLADLPRCNAPVPNADPEPLTHGDANAEHKLSPWQTGRAPRLYEDWLKGP